MPKPTPEHLEAVRKEGPVRLVCRGCNQQLDGIPAVPEGWRDVNEVQSLESSLTTYDGPDDPTPPRGYSVFDWETHEGLCPDCPDES